MQPNNSQGFNNPQGSNNPQGTNNPPNPNGGAFHVPSEETEPLPPGTLAVPNPQHVPLFDLPLELFEMVVDLFETPEDLFSLSSASRQLWNTCNAIEKYAFLDAVRFQRHFDNRIGHDPGYVWRLYLRRHPNGPVLSWLVRTWGDLNTVVRVAEIYNAVCPRAIVGDSQIGMNPLVFYMIDCDRYDLIPAMAQQYHTQWTGRLFTVQHQRLWVERAVFKCTDLRVLYWLLENYGTTGEIFGIDDLYMLEGRGLLTRFNEDWDRLEHYIPADEVIERPEYGLS
ncbi:hypothetical protein F5Y04DRAFT_278900 [Hypomontagnella monticulosa]|nr:hypothetical protein F5Y04DRAFT_278900 [Hypomontagnella monticulosa]